jgi:hypothetical protein
MSLILSIETSSQKCSVALHDQGRLIAASQSEEEGAHAKKLTLLIEEVVKKAATKVKSLVKKAKDAYMEGYNEAARKSASKRKPASKKKKISEQAILNKIHKVKKSVDVLDEAQHNHMMGKKLGLVEQIGKIKMGSVFIYYKGFSIEKMDLTIKDKKKKLPIYIVHEFGNTYKTLAAAKAAINFLAR